MNYDESGSNDMGVGGESGEPIEAMSQVADKDLSGGGHVIDNDEDTTSKKKNMKNLYILAGAATLLGSAGIWFFVLAPQLQQQVVVVDPAPVAVEAPVAVLPSAETQAPGIPVDVAANPATSVAIEPVAGQAAVLTPASAPSDVQPQNAAPATAQPVATVAATAQAAQVVAPSPVAVKQNNPVEATNKPQPKKIMVVTQPAKGQQASTPKPAAISKPITPQKMAAPKKPVSKLYELYAVKSGRAWIRDIKTNDVLMVMVGDQIPVHGAVVSISDDRIEFDGIVVE